MGKALRPQTRQERKLLVEKVFQVQNGLPTGSRQKARYVTSYPMNYGKDNNKVVDMDDKDSHGKGVPQRKNSFSKGSSSKLPVSESQASPHIGTKMLEKMGWKSGSGLGSKGDGIIAPVVLENSADIHAKMSKQAKECEEKSIN